MQPKFPDEVAAFQVAARHAGRRLVLGSGSSSILIGPSPELQVVREVICADLKISMCLPGFVLIEVSCLMAVRRVLRMGHPVLREPAGEVPLSFIGTEEMRHLVADMVDTLHDYGGIGLAAPQIGESLQLAIIEIAGGPTRYGDLESVPLTVFINPSIEVLDTAVAGYWEGCLSVPGLRGYVERPQHIKIRYTSDAGEQKQLELRGFVATVFQHEFDHLAGKLFVDRMTDTTLLVFEEEYERFHSAP